MARRERASAERTHQVRGRREAPVVDRRRRSITSLAIFRSVRKNTNDPHVLKQIEDLAAVVWNVAVCRKAAADFIVQVDAFMSTMRGHIRAARLKTLLETARGIEEQARHMYRSALESPAKLEDERIWRAYEVAFRCLRYARRKGSGYSPRRLNRVLPLVQQHVPFWPPERMAEAWRSDAVLQEMNSGEGRPTRAAAKFVSELTGLHYGTIQRRVAPSDGRRPPSRRHRPAGRAAFPTTADRIEDRSRPWRASVVPQRGRTSSRNKNTRSSAASRIHSKAPGSVDRRNQLPGPRLPRSSLIPRATRTARARPRRSRRARCSPRSRTRRAVVWPPPRSPRARRA